MQWFISCVWNQLKKIGGQNNDEIYNERKGTENNDGEGNGCY